MKLVFREEQLGGPNCVSGITQVLRVSTEEEGFDLLEVDQWGRIEFSQGACFFELTVDMFKEMIPKMEEFLKKVQNAPQNPS